MTRRDDNRAAQLRWLLGACRFWLTEAPADAPADPDDWEALARFCYFHDLDPLLHHLSADSRLALGARLPARVRRQWEDSYHRNFIFNIELLDLLEAFLRGCERRSIEVRVFKGPVTIARGWLDPALRVMADVDLICRRPDLPALAELARELDFEAGEQTAAHHLALRHRTLPGSLELHFTMYEVVGQPEALLDRLWAHPDRVEVDGRELPAPGPELGLVIDLAHLLQHDLQLNLKPLLDLSATIWRQRERLDPALLGDLLRQADLEPEFERLLQLLTRTLGLPIPEELKGESADPPEDLARSLWERLLTADRLDRIGALAGPHRRGGAAATTAYVLRRFFPPLEQLQAMTGARSRSRALLGYPAHLGATFRRALGRWSAGGSGSTGSSLKDDLFRRRRR